jgi:hypothetical protein
MKIAIDLRGLHSGKISGVENYIVNILERLVQMDHDNQYMLFENAYKTQDYSHLKYINSELVQRRLSNKIFNLSLKLFSRPHFENYFGNFDVLFMPNFNFFSVKPQTKVIVAVHDLSPIVAPQFYNFKRRMCQFQKNLGTG